MNLAQKARLEKTIQKWMDEEANAGELSGDYYHSPKLVEQMTEAAALVYDAAAEGQVYAESQTEE